MNVVLVSALLVVAAMTADQIIGYCDAMGHMTAQFAGARNEGIDRESLRQRLIHIAQGRNLDDNDSNDLSKEQQKAAFRALDYAYDNPFLSQSSTFDTVYEQCKRDHRTLVDYGEVPE